MRTNHFVLGFLLIILMTTALTAHWVWRLQVRPPAPAEPFAGPGDVTASPAPGRTGPYTVCTHDYNLASTDDQWGYGRVYAPLGDEDLCTSFRRGNLVPSRRFNLVLIAHADGVAANMKEAHLEYEELARHLASNALIVVSINRYGLKKIAGADPLFPSLLLAHLDYLYKSSPVRHMLTDHVALIGHSAGGGSVIRHSGAVSAAGRKLEAVVLMAPTMNLGDVASFDGLARAFMGLSVVDDSDFNAYGSKVEDQVMQSNFRIFDEIGLTGNPGVFTLEKEMVFVESLAALEKSHHFQNQPFALAYINAFLQRYLNGHAIFERFLKYQRRPPTLTAHPSPRVWHQHEDLSRLTVADFENGVSTPSKLGGPIAYGNGIEVRVAGEASLLDHFSPHHTNVLYVETGPGRQLITVSAPSTPIDASGFGWFGLRITQVYLPDENESGDDIDIAIRLSDGAISASVELSDHGGLLHFPPVVAAPVVPQQVGPGVDQFNGQTKNAMRSYLVSLSAFEDVDLGNIQEIEIDLGKKDLILIMDDLAFYEF